MGAVPLQSLSCMQKMDFGFRAATWLLSPFLIKTSRILIADLELPPDQSFSAALMSDGSSL